MQIEKLLEEQRKSLRAIGEGSVRFLATREEIFDWHKQSLKQLIDGLVEWEEKRVTILRELIRKYDLDIDKEREDEVQQNISHLKEIGKKLK